MQAGSGISTVQSLITTDRFFLSWLTSEMGTCLCRASVTGVVEVLKLNACPQDIVIHGNYQNAGAAAIAESLKQNTFLQHIDQCNCWCSCHCKVTQAKHIVSVWSFIVLLLIDSALVNLTWSFSVLSHSVLLLMVALLKLSLSFIVVVLIASLWKIKIPRSFNVLVLLDAALVNLTWSFNMIPCIVLVLMAALLMLPLSLIVVVLMVALLFACCLPVL
jgi:hypothetical protein